MAIIKGTQTVNNVWLLNTDTNPTLTGGVAAPIGSFAVASDGSGFFYKFNTSSTDWSKGALSTITLAEILANGALTNGVAITSNNGFSSLTLNNTGTTLSFIDADKTMTIMADPTSGIQLLSSNSTTSTSVTIVLSHDTGNLSFATAGDGLTLGQGIITFFSGQDFIISTGLDGVTGNIQLLCLDGTTGFTDIHTATYSTNTVGLTSTNKATRLDSVGFRIGTNATVDTTNLNPFTVLGNSFFGSNTLATAFIDIAAGTTAIPQVRYRSSVAPTGGALVDGVTWYDGTDYMVRTQTRSDKLARVLTGSASLDFANTNAQSSSDLTIAVTGAATGDCVALGGVELLTNCTFTAFVSTTDTVTVRFSNYSSAAQNPASATFKVTVFKNI